MTLMSPCFERLDALREPWGSRVSVLLRTFRSDEAVYAAFPDAQMKSASTIKVLILLAYLRECDRGTLRPDEAIRVDESDRVAYSLVTFLDAHEWLLGDLAKLMIATSDNTATNLVARRIGFPAIDDAAAELGLQQTRFRRLMMDFEASARGEENLTSLRDQFAMYEALWRESWLSPASSRVALEILKGALDSSLLRFFTEEECPLAHKTGGLPDVHHDAGLFYADDGAYFLGVFTNGIPEPEAKELIGRISRTVYDSRKEWHR